MENLIPSTERWVVRNKIRLFACLLGSKNHSSIVDALTHVDGNPHPINIEHNHLLSYSCCSPISAEPMRCHHGNQLDQSDFEVMETNDLNLGEAKTFDSPVRSGEGSTSSVSAS